MKPPLVTLTTDFGTRDPYVAEMKGVLLTQGPADLRVLDLSHEIGAHDVTEAAIFLRASVPRFPSGTIHVAVIDPGVGGSRRPLAAHFQGQFLVGPDNGIFAFLFDGTEKIFELDAATAAPNGLSATFHGRDLFAPAAARLANGAKLSSLGKPASGAAHLPFPMVELEGDALHAQILHVDRFGNLITNVTRETLQGFLAMGNRSDAIFRVGTHQIHGLQNHYAESEKGKPLALIGSSDLLEIAVREGNAAEKLGARRGSRILVVRP